MRWLRFILAGTLLAVGIGLAAVEAVTLRSAFAELERGSRLLAASGAAVTTSTALNGSAIDSAASLHGQADALIGPAHSRIANDRLLHILARLPIIGGDVTAVLDLADSLVAASSAEGDLITVARLYTKAPPEQSSPGARLISLLQSSEPLVASADAKLAPAVQALRRDQSRTRLPQISAQVRIGVDKLGITESALSRARDAAQALVPALGAASPKRYLVIFANPAELRPAGGLAGYLGILSIDHGQVSDLQMRHYGYYNPLFARCFPIPEPLKEHLRFYRNCFELGDATWSPDFPSSAAQAEAMLASATSEQVDGTISIDPYTIAAILTVTGPVDIPPYGTFDATNFFDRIDEIVNVEHDPEAIGVTTRAVLAKILSMPANQWPALGRVLAEEATSRHVQLSMHDKGLAALGARDHFDGSVLPTGGRDYVMVVDANVNQSKADHFMTKSADLKVEAFASGLDRHELVLKYDYPLPPQPSQADQVLNVDGRYIDYLRVYLPETANLGGIEYRIDDQLTALSPDAPSPEFKKKVVGLSFVLPRGHRGEIRIFYTVALQPGRNYDVFLQKQAGIPDRPTTVEVSHSGGIATRRTPLTHDVEFGVQW